MKIPAADEFRNRIFECSPLPIVVMDARSHRYIDCNPAAASIYGYASPDEVIGKKPLDFSAPTQYDGTPSAQKAAFHIEEAMRAGSATFEWLHRRPDGGLWDAEVHLQVFQTAGAELLQFSLVDISERKRSERTQKAVHDLILELNSCNDMIDGFGKVLQAALTIEPLDCGGIYVADPLDGSLSLAAHRGLSAEFIEEVSHFDGDSPNGRLARDGAAHYGSYADIRPATDPVRDRENLRGFALIPVIADGRFLALLNLASRRDDAIPPRSRDALETIAFQIGGSLLRLQSEAALRENEKKYRTLFSTMTQGVVYQDARGLIIDANPAAERILGLTLDQMQGRTSMDPGWKAVREDGSDFPGSEHPIPVALRTGEEVRGVVHGIYNPKKDSTIWILVNAIPLFRPGETRPWQAYAVIEDITEKRAAEELVLANERRFRELIKNSSDSVTVLDADGTQVFVSDAVERMLGYKPAELIDIPVMETMIHPDDQGAVRSAFQRIVEKGEGRAQYRHRRKDGTWAYLEAWGSNQLGNPDIRGIVVNVRDIGEQKAAEDQLRLRESYLSAIIENQPGLVWLKDEVGRFLAVNRAFAASCGKASPTELTGKTDLDIWPAGLAEKYRADDASVIAKGEPVVIEEPISTNEGTLWFETFKAPVRDPGGRIIGTTGYSRDISDRKRTEESLQNVQKLEALGVLAGGIAHDFNNLMGGLFGYLELARMECASESATEYLNNAFRAIDRARGLTNQLLTFSKGGAPVKRTGPLFPFVEETARFALSGSSVSCRFEIEEDLRDCDFDRNQIGQVIDNLVINAQQAMPMGGSIDVSAGNVALAEREHPLLPAGDYVQISIRDYGIGIPRELLSRIFDPFFTTKPRGHGLGLATSYSIMKRHSGCIEVESEQGKGSRFRLYLPAAPAAPGAGAENAAKAGAFGGSGTVLVMDDEPMMRDTISAMLKPLGYAVVCVDDGKSAVEFVSSRLKASDPPAALIFDLTVPGGMGGREAIAEIRAMPCGVPAFVVSGYADDPVVRNPAEYGFDASICKPFTRSELLEMLGKRLSKGR